MQCQNAVHHIFYAGGKMIFVIYLLSIPIGFSHYNQRFLRSSWFVRRRLGWLPLFILLLQVYTSFSAQVVSSSNEIKHCCQVQCKNRAPVVSLSSNRTHYNYSYPLRHCQNPKFYTQITNWVLFTLLLTKSELNEWK